MLSGRVQHFDWAQGVGSIIADDNKTEVAVHITDVYRSKLASLRQDQRVTFDVERRGGGAMLAVNIRTAW